MFLFIKWLTCALIYIYTYVYIYICRHICMYICVCVDIRYRALRIGCDLACRLCCPTVALRFLLMAYIRDPPWSARAWDLMEHSFLERLRNSSCLLQALGDVHYFALWFHHILRQRNLSVCSMFNHLFTASLSCKTTIFAVSFGTLQNTKAKQIKTTRITTNSHRPQHQNSPPELVGSASCFHWNRRCHIGIDLKSRSISNIFTSLFHKHISLEKQ